MLIWTAVYKDGTYLPQYNEDDSENKYGNINRDILERFILVDRETDKVKFALNLDPSKKLIFRRRTAISMQSKVTEIAYIIGWQESVRGKAVQNINFYFESTGHIEMIDGFKEDHRWFYPVRFLPEEEI